MVKATVPRPFNLNIEAMNTLHSKSNPRTDARKSKLRALTEVQKQSLLRWLNKDKVTYHEARKRLLKEFGVSLSINSIFVFWHQHNAPISPASPSPDVLVEFVIHSAQPVRVVVKQQCGEAKLS
ncbi:MAG: hypothetical protein WCH99_04320 [Verrucomicrobiota bacterium]